MANYYKLSGNNHDLGKFKISAPKIKMPKFKAPKIKMPKFKAPKLKFKAPKIKAPKLKAPKIKMPKFKAPKLPNFKAPNIKLPQFDGGAMFQGITTGLEQAIEASGGLVSTALSTASPLLSQLTQSLPGMGNLANEGNTTDESYNQEQEAISEEEAMLAEEEALLAQEEAMLQAELTSLESLPEYSEEIMYGDYLDQGEYGL
jgi:hypothetical protein